MCYPIVTGESLLLHRIFLTWYALQWYHNERLKSPASRLFIQPFVQAQVKKYRSSALLDIVVGIHRWSVNSPHKGPVTRIMFPFDDVILSWQQGELIVHYVHVYTFSFTFWLKHKHEGHYRWHLIYIIKKYPLYMFMFSVQSVKCTCHINFLLCKTNNYQVIAFKHPLSVHPWVIIYWVMKTWISHSYQGCEFTHG